MAFGLNPPYPGISTELGSFYEIKSNLLVIYNVGGNFIPTSMSLTLVICIWIRPCSRKESLVPRDMLCHLRSSQSEVIVDKWLLFYAFWHQFHWIESEFTKLYFIIRFLCVSKGGLLLVENNSYALQLNGGLCKLQFGYGVIASCLCLTFIMSLSY
jgi:hypothetical protein